MTTTHDVPMPEPDVYRYNHWIGGPRVEWSSIRLDHSFTLPGVEGYVQGEPHFSLTKLRAYADARCAELEAVIRERNESIRKWADWCKEAEAERDALAEKVKAMQDDARRYRWLRTFPNNVRPQVYAPCGLLMREEHLDAAIDAAGGDQC